MALLGFLLVIPFILLNTIVAKQLDPVFSLIRPGAHTSSQEFFLLFSSILLILIGAGIAASPLLKKTRTGALPFYPMNALVATFLLFMCVTLVSELGSEIYQCDILQIPHCD